MNIREARGIEPTCRYCGLMQSQECRCIRWDAVFQEDSYDL